mmetsp:Transcript_10707/g.29643  ORF Transcript_10707/g.29643 Transcript_10707/m.29643 type:complete len:405 (+) Transcript_10707:1346-2560(+)|eukprot:scaffold27339_cov28-Tisochrysis_lutea.AAC.3
MPLKGGEDFPAHLAPLGVAGVVPHVVECLDRLGPANVEGGVLWRHHIPAADAELDVLRGEAGTRPPVHLVARLANGVRKCHVLGVVRPTVLCTNREHGAGEASEMVHFVRQLAVAHVVGDVDESRRAGPLHHVPRHREHRLVEHLTQVRFAPAGEQPLLDEVLVEGIRERAHRHLGGGPRAGTRADEGGIQAKRRALPDEKPDRRLRHVPVAAAARVVGEVLELELQSAILGKDGVAAAPLCEGALPRAIKRNGRTRDAVRVVGEGVHHHLGELLRLAKEDALARELVGGEQSAQDADNRLEHRDASRAPERQLCRHPLLGLLKLGLHSEEPQIVQAVDERRAQVQPVVRPVADRLDLVLAKGMLSVGAPRATEHGVHVLHALARKRVGRVDLGWRAAVQPARG